MLFFFAFFACYVPDYGCLKGWNNAVEELCEVLKKKYNTGRCRWHSNFNSDSNFNTGTVILHNNLA